MKEITKPESGVLAAFESVILNGNASPLPGHKELEFIKGIPNYPVPISENARSAAVVLMVHATRGTPSILFIQRTSHIPEDKHRGQIAFPGGKLEENETLKECAFREMHEEIGIWLPPHHPVKKLTPLYVPVSNFLIHPYVAIRDTIPTPQPNPEEVSAIIDSPLTDVKNRYCIRRKNIAVSDRLLKNMPYYHLGEYTLWGATALIFSEFLKVFHPIE